ncbi:MAG: flagellin [Pseudomonadota bacterium]|nr:flagellin [Pseudomonadota bacterium]
MTRIADISQNKLVTSHIVDTRSRLADTQAQISSHQKSQDYAGIASDSMQLVSLETSERRMQQYLTDNVYVDLRLNGTLNSIDALKHSITDIRGLLRSLMVDGELATGIDKDNICDVKTQEIEDFLNTTINGRYLFSGSKTNTRPVETGTMSNAPQYDANFVTKPESSFYYQGDDTIIKARIDEGVVMEYGVTAANSGFEKLIRSIRILRSTNIDGVTDTDYMKKVEHALNLINEAAGELQGLEMNIGTRVQQLELTNKNIKISQNFARGIISDIESTDTYQAVAELTQDQTMLEASYSTMVRLSNLTLTKFL